MNEAPRLASTDELPPEVLAEVLAAWRELRQGGFALIRLERGRTGHAVSRVTEPAEGAR